MTGYWSTAAFDCGQEETRKAREYAETTCRECCEEQAEGCEETVLYRRGEAGPYPIAGWCKRCGRILDERELEWTREEAGCA